MTESAAVRRSFNPWALSGIVCLIVVLLYFVSLPFYDVPDTRKGVIRELQYLSGALSWVCACIIMITAARPRMLEKFIAVDQSYKLHKSLGILCALFGVLHFFAKDMGIQVMDLLNIEFPAAVSGASPKGPAGAGAGAGSGLGISPRQFAQYCAHFSYFGLALVLITFIPKIPYRFWQKSHRILALVFIVMCAHCWILTESYQINSPLAWLMTALSIAALPGAVMGLIGKEGCARTVSGTLVSLNEEAPYLKLTIKVPKLPLLAKLVPGKFMLIKVKGSNKHPLTIARVINASLPEPCFELFITNKGFFVSQVKSLEPGAEILCEGPYGENCLKLPDAESKAAWVMQGSGMAQGLAFCQLARHGLVEQPKTAAEEKNKNGSPGDGRLEILLLGRNADDALLMQLTSELYALAPQVALNEGAREVIAAWQGQPAGSAVSAASASAAINDSAVNMDAPNTLRKSPLDSLVVKLNVQLSSKHGRVTTAQLTALVSESTYCSAGGAKPIKNLVYKLFKAQGGRSRNFSAEHSSWR